LLIHFENDNKSILKFKHLYNSHKARVTAKKLTFGWILHKI